MMMMVTRQIMTTQTYIVRCYIISHSIEENKLKKWSENQKLRLTLWQLGGNEVARFSSLSLSPVSLLSLSRFSSLSPPFLFSLSRFSSLSPASLLSLSRFSSLSFPFLAAAPSPHEKQLAALGSIVEAVSRLRVSCYSDAALLISRACCCGAAAAPSLPPATERVFAEVEFQQQWRRWLRQEQPPHAGRAGAPMGTAEAIAATAYPHVPGR
jgi:hypothetical protein